MRAMVLQDRALLYTGTHPAPEAGGEDALVRVTRVALGRADLRLVDRGTPRPIVPGHEFVGVVQRGPTDSSLACPPVGARVAVDPEVVCGRCDLCRGGLRTHCRERRVLGVCGRDGGLADLVAAPARNLRPLPNSMPDDEAVFCESLGGVLHAAQLVRLDARAFVTVLGESPTALLSAQVMARRNATVRLVSRSGAALELCEKWGVRRRHLDEAGLRQDQDVVVDCLGTAEGQRLAAAMTRPRGSIILQAAGEALDPTPIHERELQVFGSRGCSFAEAVAELTSGRIETAGLIGRRFPLEQAAAAFDHAARGGPAKTLIEV